jgi:hypothetical protein
LSRQRRSPEAAYLLAEKPERLLAVIVIERGSPTYAAWRTLGQQTRGTEVTTPWIACVADRALVFETLFALDLSNAVAWLEHAVAQPGRWLPVVVGAHDGFRTAIAELPQVP